MLGASPVKADPVKAKVQAGLWALSTPAHKTALFASCQIVGPDALKPEPMMIPLRILLSSVSR
jgi:hypothetical protein